MPTIISGKHLKLNSPLKIYILQKLRKIKKLSPHILEFKAELDKENNKSQGDVFRAEISLKLAGKIIKAGQKSKHMREAIDLCIPKITRQINKYKTITRKSKQPGNKTIRKQ
ncbi:MAG: ribosome hibernation-promoting factor, HPF/YfiA family [Candidatus Kerfeldbacteria bacterium]|jgi:ribosomal subunit interface protein